MKDKYQFENIKSFSSFFKLFESSNLNDVVKDIEDMLIPIEDLGYTTTVIRKHFPSIQGKEEVRREVIYIHGSLSNIIHYTLAFANKNISEVNSDIADALHHIISYATSEGFTYHNDIYGDIEINIDNLKVIYTLKDLEELESGKILTFKINLYRNVDLTE